MAFFTRIFTFSALIFTIHSASANEFGFGRGGWGGDRGDDHHSIGISGTADVHRFFTGQSHFYTLNAYEGHRAGFRYEGVAFQTFKRRFPNATAVYRCSTGRSQFLSNDPYCEGRMMEGRLGFLLTSPQGPMRNEVVRCFSGRAHLITTNRHECYQAGYRVEGVLGYTF